MNVKNPISEIFRTWRVPMETLCGEGNVSMEQSATAEKAPYARIYLMGMPGRDFTLQADEAAVTISLQVECFADGQYAIEDVYDLDETSHETLTSLGFRRFYGPELITNIDDSVKRTVSRYRRHYAGSFTTNQTE